MSDKERTFYYSLLEVLKKHEFVTAKMLSEATKMPDSTVRRYLSKFEELNIIGSEGKNKGKKYFLL